MRLQQLIANLGLILALGVAVAAEQGVIRREEPPQSGREVEQSSVRFAGPWRPNNATGDTKVIGTVIDIRQVPVPAVHVQLRNLDTGSVVLETNANDLGEYEFAVENSGTYVVEMVQLDGYVAALSNAGSLARFETLQTVVQLPGRWDSDTRSVVPLQSMTSFFGMSAATTMTATTIQIAVNQDVRPADPGTPVSP